jgi:hypothetical protein|nr:MAG TPA: DNA binding protein [Microviridae sp.]
MSKKVLVSVYDKVANLYFPIITEINLEVAVRNFREGAKKNPQIGAYPSDYELHHVGYFDDETGQVLPVSANTLETGNNIVIRASEVFPNDSSC